jgi:hypothetical protein
MLHLVQDLHHLPQPPLRAVGGDALLALHGILAEAEGARQFVTGGAQHGGDLARSELPVIDIGGDGHAASSQGY